MDSGTHLVVGLGLAGLAHVDPVVASDSTVALAVLIGTVLGQQAPDADGILRLKGNAVYIKNHRGLSHSLPAQFMWAVMITLALSLVFADIPILHVGGWVLLAVVLHVCSDLFNTYGTQAFRPFTQKWISWNIIHIFDPVIFFSHLFAIGCWALKLADPAILFPVLYGLLVVYYGWRTVVHFLLENKMRFKDPFYTQGDAYMLIPTVHLYAWNVVKSKADGGYLLGELRNRELKWVDQEKCAVHPAVEASKSHPDVAAFLYFSSYACAELRNHSWGYEIRWLDVRYRHRKQYPFVAVLLMDHQFKPLDSYIGWLSDTRLKKRLGIHTN